MVIVNVKELSKETRKFVPAFLDVHPIYAISKPVFTATNFGILDVGRSFGPIEIQYEVLLSLYPYWEPGGSHISLAMIFFCKPKLFEDKLQAVPAPKRKFYEKNILLFHLYLHYFITVWNNILSTSISFWHIEPWYKFQEIGANSCGYIGFICKSFLPNSLAP